MDAVLGIAFLPEKLETLDTLCAIDLGKKFISVPIRKIVCINVPKFLTQNSSVIQTNLVL